MPYRHTFLLLLLLFGKPALADDLIFEIDCKAALAQIEKDQDEASATLDHTFASDNAAYCAALLHDAETIERAVRVYAVCLPDEEGKADGLAALGKTASDMREMMIGESCPGT